MKERLISKNLRRVLLISALVLELTQFGIQAIPVIGQMLATIIGGISWLSYFLIFKAHGIKFVNPKKALNLGLSAFVELAPIINALPALTLYVWKTLSDNKKNFPPQEPTPA